MKTSAQPADQRAFADLGDGEEPHDNMGQAGGADHSATG